MLPQWLSHFWWDLYFRGFVFIQCKLIFTSWMFFFLSTYCWDDRFFGNYFELIYHWIGFSSVWFRICCIEFPLYSAVCANHFFNATTKTGVTFSVTALHTQMTFQMNVNRCTHNDAHCDQFHGLPSFSSMRWNPCKQIGQLNRNSSTCGDFV